MISFEEFSNSYHIPLDYESFIDLKIDMDSFTNKDIVKFIGTILAYYESLKKYNEKRNELYKEQKKSALEQFHIYFRDTILQSKNICIRDIRNSHKRGDTRANELIRLWEILNTHDMESWIFTEQETNLLKYYSEKKEEERKPIKPKPFQQFNQQALKELKKDLDYMLKDERLLKFMVKQNVSIR
jgi:hypothetical protein